ncbi:DUF3012 domain-containing protein [Teredinibacter purpureus]|uniref:DUF3012 domain-containing protein n=1 Tax=Teredinibacter purpureus TaxID=2731756 RepID=UPI0005F7973C|nr:DUF3012 domain-containing protein [Teredinibacter purpureus]
MNIGYRIGVYTFLGLLYVMLLGCAEKKMTEEWCEALMERPNNQWTEDDAVLFARDCLYSEGDSTE